MVLVDTDILSIFAKIDRLPLLFSVFNQAPLHFAAAVKTEVQRGVALGFGFAGDIMTLHTQGRILSLHPAADDQHFMATLPPPLIPANGNQWRSASGSARPLPPTSGGSSTTAWRTGSIASTSSKFCVRYGNSIF